MNMQKVFTGFWNLRYSHDERNIGINQYFEYCWYEDGSAEIFLKNKDVTMLGWDSEGLPSDPRYNNHRSDKKPILHRKFKQLNLHDEMVFQYMIYTLNSITVIHHLDRFNKINDFMKNYSFFQLTRLSKIKKMVPNKVKKIQSLLFYYFLYCHPVNNETLNSFAIVDDQITHIPTGIKMKDYSLAYYRYYIENHKNFQSWIKITPREIDAIGILNHSLINMLETGHPHIDIPPSNYFNLNIAFINDVDTFIELYSQRDMFFKYLHFLLRNEKTDGYSDYYLSVFLQNYVVYIISDDFFEINSLLSYFYKCDCTCACSSLLINKIYSDAIFIKYIMNEQGVKFSDIEYITVLFNDVTNEIYRLL